VRALPPVGLGGAPLGGMFEAVAEDVAVATIDAAVSAGWTHVDTAPLYGHGLSESRIGAALATLGHDVVVSTKVGRLVTPVDEREAGDIFLGAPPGSAVFDFTAAGVRRSLAASFERLQREHVDIVLVHDPEDHLDVALTEAVGALRDLREEGRLDAIGVGTNFVDVALRFVRAGAADVVLIAGCCTLLDRGAEPVLLPECADRGVQVICGGVFNSGVLADPSGGSYAYGPVPDDVRRRVTAMAVACEHRGVPLAAAAIQHPSRHDAVTSIVVGCRSAADVHDDQELLGVDVPLDLWDELDAIAKGGA
jgi:D-threo-aldose 1-dehydrogenase